MTTTQTQDLAPTSSVKDYVDAGALRTYYEAQGTGESLVLLHGGFASVDVFGGGFTPLLAERYRVYSPERRGHGRMPDVEGPITYEIMADDTTAFIEALGIGPAHVVGWSDGANVGLIAALRRPDLVRKLVVIGTAVTISGGRPWAQAMMDGFTVNHLPPMLLEVYAALSPDGPDHFPVVFDKIRPALLVTETQLTDLATITAPTLVMAGDDDLVTVEHLEAMRTTLPDGQLAIVPGTSHGLPLEKPELVSRLIFDFLAEEQAEKFMPRPK
ncbi:alpha/beta hydrolase [Streptomyces sp. SID13666]|uniref:alpha/beta fold hydrolase n=1 Tax=unclassified Streptomyces TaxID=2593676 RepID=UPI0013C24C75|nr:MULTISPECIES: alpha/beta hydrolase [unclassified Streptomyces]NEA57141.1 alpha/beta hydrolase [Streptomyces sp. SID13666]NEA76885.1 alpha/beta hydrolase [Streptomyces sp. SID13588]